MWLPLACPLLGTWPATQVCALTGNWTGDPNFGSQACTQSTEPHQPGTFFKFSQAVFQSGLAFIFPPAIFEESSFSASSSAFGFVTVFNVSYFTRWVVISHRAHNLRFSSGSWCWTSFHVFLCHGWNVMPTFKLNYYYFFTIEFWKFLYILEIRVLCQICSLQIFSTSL